MNNNLNLDLLKQDVEKEIREKGFENLYYALFDEHSSQLWAIHLYYRDGKFMVNSRDDRTYIMGKTREFDNFEEAKLSFLNLMESFIEMNGYFVQNGDSPYYSCSLWDEKGDV